MGLGSSFQLHKKAERALSAPWRRNAVEEDMSDLVNSSQFIALMRSAQIAVKRPN